MKAHRTQIVVIVLLVLIIGVPFALRPRVEGSADQAGAAGPLIIYTPNNEQIRYEFAHAFNRWREARQLPGVRFDWRASGGTSDLRRQVLAQFAAAAGHGRADDGIGADLFFGGGVYAHEKLAQGVSIKRNGRIIHISASIPVKLPAGMLEKVFPQPDIGGEPLYRPDLKWVGVVLASFGIVYNRDVLTMLHLPEPGAWRDLRDPGYRGWVALADPAHSGSIAETYDVILRRRGWREGWALLRRIFANARYFTSSAGKVPVDVSSGEAAAGMCIDFYGRFQAGAVPHGRVGYVDPQYMTAVTADPISILRGAPHHDLANQFVVWLLSPQAQELWQRKLGSPGGPVRFELRRQPIRRDVYTTQARAAWTDPEIDPFVFARPIPKAMPSFFNMVAPVSHAMGIDVHDELVAAWAAIQRTASNDPHMPEMLRLFDAMPPELELHWPDDELRSHWQEVLTDPHHPLHEEAAATLAKFHQHLAQLQADQDRLLRDRIKWTLFFRANYRKIVALAGR